jgi:DNA-binding transcriptional MerR regulator
MNDDDRERRDTRKQAGDRTARRHARGHDPDVKLEPTPGAMTLGELTEEADVSVRTVRYYIAEGLLPPPEGAGPASAYTPGHLDRLRLIQRLKEAYLPLKEIRRRLAGLDDDAVRAVLAAGESDVSTRDLTKPAWDDSLADARAYLALLESGEPYRTEPLPLRFQGASASPPPGAAALDAAAAPRPTRSQPPLASGVFSARPPQKAEPEPATGLWHRIPLGDEAELVISDRVYGRHRDRVDWLVRWARKVFG